MSYRANDLLIQFIEGDKLDNYIKKEDFTNKAVKSSIAIKYDVSIFSGCENGIYVTNKDNSHWLDRHQRSHVEFNILDKELALKILKKLENLDYIFTAYNSFDNITITNISKEEKTFNLIKERIYTNKKLLNDAIWKNIKDMDRNYTNKSKPGYSFIIAAPEYCTGDVEKDLQNIIN